MRDKKGDLVNCLECPTYEIRGKVILPTRTVSIQVSCIDNLPLPLYIKTLDEVPIEGRSLDGGRLWARRDSGIIPDQSPREITTGVVKVAVNTVFRHKYGRTLSWRVFNSHFAEYDPQKYDYLVHTRNLLRLGFFIFLLKLSPIFYLTVTLLFFLFNT